MTRSIGGGVVVEEEEEVGRWRWRGGGGEEEEGVGKELGDGCLALLELDHLCLLVHVDNMVERQLEANLLSHNLT